MRRDVKLRGGNVTTCKCLPGTHSKRGLCAFSWVSSRLEGAVCSSMWGNYCLYGRAVSCKVTGRSQGLQQFRLLMRNNLRSFQNWESASWAELRRVKPWWYSGRTSVYAWLQTCWIVAKVVTYFRLCNWLRSLRLASLLRRCTANVQ